MNDILNKITDIVDRYDSGEWQSLDNLRAMLRNLSNCYYYLTKYNVECAQDWNKEVYKFKGSNAAAEKFADLTVPELRISRKILMATDRVLNSMRSEIGILKNEQ